MSKKAKISTNLHIDGHESTDSSSQASPSSYPLLFGKKNYTLMLLGLGVIFLGFVLMMGKNNNVEGASAVFPASDIYSVRRIVIAPIVIIIGFLIELYSILLIKKSA